MDNYFVLLVVCLLVDLAFLVLCMHVAGRKFGIDFGPFRTAVTKGAVILLVGMGIRTGLGLFLGGSIYAYIALLIIMFGVYYLAFVLAFGLESVEAKLFVVIYFVASWLLRVGIVIWSA